MNRPQTIELAVAEYASARHYVENTQFASEIAWQRDLDFASFSETDLLREAAWVVLCSGFREQTVRAVFDSISLCFCDWESAESIVKSGPVCWQSALHAFNNQRKLSAIYGIAADIYITGFEQMKCLIDRDPLTSVQRFPFIGSVTSQHLAKNLGFNVAKDDRHLLRFSNSHGFKNANELCEQIALVTGDKTNVIDIVLWRYLADNPSARHAMVG